MSDTNSPSVSTGIGVGNVIAAVISWCTWHSIGWMLLHLCFGWAYVIYWAIEYYGKVQLSW